MMREAGCASIRAGCGIAAQESPQKKAKKSKREKQAQTDEDGGNKQYSSSVCARAGVACGCPRISPKSQEDEERETGSGGAD